MKTTKKTKGQAQELAIPDSDTAVALAEPPAEPVRADVGKRVAQFRALSDEVTIDEERRVIRFVASTEDVDRYGDKILVDGWEWRTFNGSFLWSHDRSQPPVGRVINVEKGSHKGKSALLCDVEFPQDDVDPEGARVWRLYASGFMRSVSVGFLPLSIRVPQTAAEREKEGLGTFGVVYEKQELLELSAVTVPANPFANIVGARALAQRGLITSAEVDEADACMRDVDEPLTPSPDLGKIESAIKELAALVQDRLPAPRSVREPEAPKPAPQPGAHQKDLVDAIFATRQSVRAAMGLSDAPQTQRAQPASGRSVG